MLRSTLSLAARTTYRIPLLGIYIRSGIEKLLGPTRYQDRAYWNDSLKGWASSYLGGTVSIDLRDYTTVRLAKMLVPQARSLLDLGCAGGSLALQLPSTIKDYVGVDISDVAIAVATKRFAVEGAPTERSYELQITSIGDYKPARTFDIIVFNEVLYYLPLKELEATIKRFSEVLNPNGIIIISLKEHELSRFVQEKVSRCLRFEQGLLFQQKPDGPSWQTARNSEAPAFLVQGFRVLAYMVTPTLTAFEYGLI